MFSESSYTMSLALAVGGFGTMLPLVVVFGNVQRNFKIGRCQGIWLVTEQDGAEGEASDVFEDIGMLDGIGWGFSPCERGVSGDQNAGDGEGVKTFGFESADDDCAGIADVGLGDFFGCQRFGYGNGAVEVVGVGCAKAGNGAAGLSPGGSELGMGVDDAADLREFTIETGVRVEIA